MTPSRLNAVLRVGYAREVATGMQAGASASNPGLLTPARLKQIRLELVNQLPLILRDANVLKIHAELMDNIGTLSEDAFRAKVNALNDVNIASIQKEKERLNRQYLSTYQSLSGSAAAAHLSMPAYSAFPYQAQLPNRYISFEEFCNGMNLSADMRARCRTAWQEGGGVKTIAGKIGNIVGKERLKAYLASLDITHYNLVLLHPDESVLRGGQDDEDANLLLSLQR